MILFVDELMPSESVSQEQPIWEKLYIPKIITMYNKKFFYPTVILEE